MTTDERLKDRFLRDREVRKLTGLSRTTRWRLEAKGQFPKRRKLSENTVGWLASEVADWLESRTSVVEAVA